MCILCNSNVNRSYTHSRTSYHRKLLFKKMKELKQRSVEKYGIFIWEGESDVKDKK